MRLAMNLALLFALLLALPGSSSPALAQPSPSTGASPLPQKLRNVFAVPEIPAAALLSGTPLEISRAGTFHDLGSALISGIDRSGRVRQGLAVEAAPFLLWGSGIDLPAYRTRLGYARANLKFSLATARTAGDSGSTDIAVGIRTTVFDDRDFMRDKAMSDSLGAILRRCADRFVGPTPGPVDTAKVNGCYRQWRAPLMASWEAPRWNASSLVIAAAYDLRLEESVLRQSRGTGGRAWFSYARGVREWGQLLTYGGADYVRGRTADSTYTAATGGVRALVGAERVNGFYQNSWQWRDTRTGSALDDGVGEWTAGIEFSAREGIWLSTGFGGAYADASSPDRVVVFANLRWGVASAARFSPAAR